MQTEVNEKISNSKPIVVGVPQGSILGPLLFLIYINDFPKCLTSGKAIMFADDANLFFNSSSYKALYEVTNTQLKHVEAWLSANKLTLNTDNTLRVAFMSYMLRLELQIVFLHLLRCQFNSKTSI